MVSSTESRAIITTSTASDELLSREEVKAFHRFVAQLDSPATSNSMFDHSGISMPVLDASISARSSFWVIDSRASQHMTSMSSLFSFYHVCLGRDKVRIADGSYSSIASKCDIVASPSLHLSSVFHILNFSLNPLSINHITKSLHCSATFFPSHYVF